MEYRVVVQEVIRKKANGESKKRRFVGKSKSFAIKNKKTLLQTIDILRNCSHNLNPKSVHTNEKINCKKHGLTLKENGECFKCKIVQIANKEEENAE